jgi:hypothetical protein
MSMQKNEYRHANEENGVDFAGQVWYNRLNGCLSFVEGECRVDIIVFGRE